MALYINIQYKYLQNIFIINTKNIESASYLEKVDFIIFYYHTVLVIAKNILHLYIHAFTVVHITQIGPIRRISELIEFNPQSKLYPSSFESDRS